MQEILDSCCKSHNYWLEFPGLSRIAVLCATEEIPEAPGARCHSHDNTHTLKVELGIETCELTIDHHNRLHT